ncbi:hypothetical protein IWQ62_006649, partial [Dispira parvispora]
AGDGFEASLKTLKQGLKSVKQQATRSTTSHGDRDGRDGGSDAPVETPRGSLSSASVLRTTPSRRRRSASMVLPRRRLSMEPFAPDYSGLELLDDSFGQSVAFGQGSMVSEKASPSPSFSQVETNLEAAQNVIGQVCSLANDLQRRVHSIESK